MFTLRNRGQRWRVINLAVRERMGRMDRRRVRFYHHAFVWALNEALQTGALVLFRSHLLWPAQVRLSDLTLGSTCRRHHIVTVVIPSYERRLMTLLQDGDNRRTV